MKDQSKTKQTLIQKRASLDEASEYAENIINTVREPLIVLDQDLRVVTASRSFYEFFKVKPEETEGQLIYNLGNKQWDIPKLRELLETILPQKATFDNYEVEHYFATIGKRIMLLNARQIQRVLGKERIILLAIEDITERKILEDILTESEELYRGVFRTASDGILLLEKREGKITHINPAAEKMLGYSPKESIGNKLQDIGISLDMGDFQTTMQNLNKNGIINYTAVPVTTKSGQQMDTDIYLVDRATLVQCSIRDVTERKRAEEELSRVNRVLRMLSNTNQALIKIADEATLLNEVCRISVEVGGYRLTWVGFAEQDEAKTVRPVAHAGFGSGYIESAKVTWADNERGRGPGGTAIRTGQPYIARNIPLDPAFAPWREAAIERGYKSNIALPLISEGQTFGELAIYSVEADAFDAKEVEILKELADDLAFGITALRTRVKRDQTEVALRESEEQYRLIAENTADTIAVFDLNLNPTYISPSILKLRGYPVQEAMTQTLNQMLTPDSLQHASKMFADQIALESSGTADPTRTALIELEEYCKDGSTIWVELAASFLRDNNFKPTGILTVTRDITERKQAEAELQQTLESLRKAFGATIQVMVSAVEIRDPYTAGHQVRVADLARTIATEMGLPQEKIDGILMAGSIHDIGKLSVPAEILSKPTKLTDLEFSLIKEHSRIGYEMLKDVESPWPLAEIVYQHHERMNGSGYPINLKGDEILIEARIMAVADVVESMASHRPYRPALGIETALEEIEKNKGILYDDAVTDACLRLFREKGFQLKVA
jgi:PAS domain S-box-containing protein